MKSYAYLFAPLLTLAVAGCASTASPTPEKPLYTQLTKESGGDMPATQKDLLFKHAELHWQVFPETQTIAGHAVLRFAAKAALTTFSVDLDRELPISQIAVNGQTLSANQWQNPEGREFITLPQTVAQGAEFTVTIDYAGKPHQAKHAPWDGGFVWSKTENGQPWIATAVQGEGCDLFWPCIDQPMGEPLVADLFIKVPAPLIAPSNGKLIDITEQDGWNTYHWQVQQPNTYAVALNIGPYEELQADYHSKYGHQYSMQYWYLKGDKKDASVLFQEFPKQLEFFERYIGPYPFWQDKMGVVNTPHLGMEHQTINAYGNHYAKGIFGYDSLLQHELAHEWFGNQLTNENWDDFWLHESFATYMQPLYAEYLHGKMAYDAQLYGLRAKVTNKAPMVSGESKTEEGVYDEKRGPGQDIYNKGALMLHTLRNYLGDEKFFRAVRELVYGTPNPQPGNFKPIYSNTKTFIAIVNRVSGEDMTGFFNTYLYQAKLPQLVSEREGDVLKIRWQQTTGDFALPVEVLVDGKLFTVSMPHGHGELVVGNADRIQLDPKQKLLKDEPYFAEHQAWTKAQKEKAVKAKKATTKS
ncbi:M1 family metallopeptidase [Shewanella mangrovi]|uniref:M1 family metallopeptidase n=1 Tax=Shewanella mangrovi TaxID=1515746 RepID=UPI000561776F|nr:M1 family metallopeptidase [Shewanella mangrovi]